MDLDRWLAKQFDDARLAALTSRGNAMGPRELQALMQTVAGREALDDQRFEWPRGCTS